MTEQFPGLRAALVEDDLSKADKLGKLLSGFGVPILGRLATVREAWREIQNGTPDSPIYRSNLIFVDGNINPRSGSGCGDGNQILLALMQRGAASTPRYFERDEASRVAFGCSDDPRNAFASALCEPGQPADDPIAFNFSPRHDTVEKLGGMLHKAVELLQIPQ